MKSCQNFLHCPPLTCSHILLSALLIANIHLLDIFLLLHIYREGGYRPQQGLKYQLEVWGAELPELLVLYHKYQNCHFLIPESTQLSHLRSTRVTSSLLMCECSSSIPSTVSRVTLYLCVRLLVSDLWLCAGYYWLLRHLSNYNGVHLPYIIIAKPL